MTGPGGNNYVPDLTEYLAPTCAVLTELTDAAQALAPPSGLPAADSKAMTERAEEATFINEHWEEPVRSAHAVAGVLTFAATDHVRNYGKHFHAEPVPVYTHLVTARAALDAAGVAYWMADCGIGTEARVQRYAVSRFMSAEQYDRSPMPGAKEQAKKIVANVRAGATAHGWTTSRSSGRVGREDQPSSKKLIRSICDDDRIFGLGEVGVGDLLWWYLSGATHSAAYALMQSVQMDEEATTEYGGGEPMAAIFTSAGTAQRIGLTLACAYETTVNEHRRLMGWESERWTAAERKLHELLKTVRS